MPGAALASSITLQGATLRPALTTYGDPADYVVTPPSSYDGVARLLVSFPSGTLGGSAALLWNNQYLLTAAHMVVQGTTGNFTFPTSFSATFNLSGGPVTLYGAQYFVNPGWTGDVNYGNDLAVVRLASPAPISGYQIYRDPSSVGVVADLVGYGRSGNGNVGNVLPWGTLRQGQNRYDAFWNMPGYPYAFDFDDGTAAHDAFGYFNVTNFGTGKSEVDISFGDSGGPGFINGKIAGVHSFITTFGPSYGDIDTQLNSSFGEAAGDMRVAVYANWIDSVVNPVPSPGTLMLLGSGLVGLLVWGRCRRSI